jgi:hypothetical protein
MTDQVDSTNVLIPNTDHWKTEEILHIVDTIHKSGSSVPEREAINKIRFAEFLKRYPMLFMMACEDHYDKVTLTYMMNMRNKVLSDECSVESASRVIGNKFFNKFVSPVVNDLNANKNNETNKKPKLNTSNVSN